MSRLICFIKNFKGLGLAFILVGLISPGFADEQSDRFEVQEPTSQVGNGAVESQGVQPQLKEKVTSSRSTEDPVSGPFSLGPTVGIAIPHPANIGLEGRFNRYFGFAINYGFLPQISFEDVKLKMNSYDARVRIFPFQGAFFVGTSFGKQSIVANTVAITDGTASSLTLEATTLYLTPTLGWRWGGQTGLIFGIDFGWQVVLSSSAQLRGSYGDQVIQFSPEYQEAKADVERVAKDIAQTSLPSFTMIHIGYLF
jgi:hypothetical protein